MKLILDILGAKWELPRREISEVPASPVESVGYVEFAGSTRLHRAEYRNGRWVDHRRRPFDREPVAWYALAGMKRA